jgi:hypothetical protein
MRLTLVITLLIMGALLTYAKLVAIAQAPPYVPASVRVNAAGEDFHPLPLECKP